MSDSIEITIVDHPLVADALSRIRDVSTPNSMFRDGIERMGMLLLAEATRHLPLTDVVVDTPITSTHGRQLLTHPVIVPVLRAGLGFVPPAQMLLPQADIGFVGISRDEETFKPKPYVNKLPENLSTRPVIIVDPMLATGGSLALTCDLLAERGAPTPFTVVCALAAPEGIDRLRDAGLHLRIFTGAIDEQLNENAFIVPGLGDAGDRLFGRFA